MRETITYLDLAVSIRPCAAGSRHRAEVVALSGRDRPTFPFLVDEAAGVNMFESADICAHLLATRGRGVAELPAPADFFLPSTFVTGWVPSLLRPGRGTAVEPGVRGRPSADSALVLYSYEGNQFCRLVREVLAELDLPYELRSTGKGSPRRAELAERSGGSTVAPFLLDANGVAMGESADIVDYLWRSYS